MATETELKLSIPSADVERFMQHPLLAQSTSQPSQQHLLGTYYDTPDLALQKAQLGLRIRREGERWIQTVKTGGEGVGGLHQRQEWEVEVADNQLEFSSLPKVVQENLLADERLRERIVPLFTTDFQRVTWHVEDPNGSLIEVCLDQGEVRQGDKSTPLCEVELELKRGEATALFELALQLTADFPLLLENTSKAQRGYELLHPRSIAAVAPSPPPLHQDMNAREAFSHLLWHYLACLHANQTAALHQATAAEGVAQLCHAIHRLHSSFAICRKWLPADSSAPLLAELDWLAQQLQSVHSWNAFNDMLEAVELQVGQQAALRELAVMVEGARLQAHKSLTVTLNSPRYTRLLLRLNLYSKNAWQRDLCAETLAKWQRSLPDFARKRLAKQHKRLSAKEHRVSTLTAQEQAHLWQECSRMEALLEFFMPLYAQPKTTHKQQQRYAAALAQLREQLNNQYEVHTARQLLTQAALNNEHPACYFLQGWYAAKRHLKIERLEQTWTIFHQQKAFWKPKNNPDSA